MIPLSDCHPLRRPNGCTSSSLREGQPVAGDKVRRSGGWHIGNLDIKRFQGHVRSGSHNCTTLYSVCSMQYSFYTVSTCVPQLHFVLLSSLSGLGQTAVVPSQKLFSVQSWGGNLSMLTSHRRHAHFQTHQDHLQTHYNISRLVTTSLDVSQHLQTSHIISILVTIISRLMAN